MESENLSRQMRIARPDQGPHIRYMKKALLQAWRAFDRDEVPVGAVVVHRGQIVGRGFNQPIRQHDPSAHAEILALRHAARRLGNYRLTSAALYCTLEPCAMCAAALVHARVGMLVYGARDSKAGAVDSHLQLLESRFLNHRVEVIAGILEDDCSKLLKEFFRLKRIKS